MNESNRIGILIVRVLLAIALVACVSRRVRAQDINADGAADGSALAAQSPAMLEEQPGTEKFISQPAAQLRSFAGGTLVLRASASVSDSVVRVKNVCRWSQSDATFFAPVADLTVSQLKGGGIATITIDQIRLTLSGAGMNVAMIRFNGAESCAVNRAGEQVDEQSALEDWVDSHQAVPAADTEGSPTVQVAARAPAADAAPLHSLRQILLADLCRRMQLDAANVEMSFDAADNKVLNLVEPYFQFEVTPRRVRMLSDLNWEVTIVANGERHKTVIAATARLWETETLAVKPIAYQQIIREDDVEEKRVLLDQVPSEPLLTKAQAVGQGAARELKPGMTLTSSMVDPALLARVGQLVTINVVRGSVRITAVAKALENGSYGQTIRARNDVDPTRLFEVTLTGPQEGVVTDEMNQGTPAPIAAAAN
jgi:flagella basal body P-ring formation protein FlgA